MAEMDKLKVILVAFIVLIIGIVLLQVTADNNYKSRNLDTVSNDSTSSLNSTCTQFTTGCVDAITAVTNESTIYGSSNYTLCRSASNNLDGILLSSGMPTDTVNVTYTQSADCTYVDDTVSRTLLDLIPIFFAIGLVVGIGIWVFMKTKEGVF